MHDDPRVGVNKGEMFKRAIFRPVQMLFGDPIVFLASLYVSFLFGVLYVFPSIPYR